MYGHCSLHLNYLSLVSLSVTQIGALETRESYFILENW